MGMPYVLGIDIGASTTTAAVCRRGEPAGSVGPVPPAVRGPFAWGPAEPVALDEHSVAAPSAIALHPGAGDRPVRAFLHRVGDHIPLMFGDQTYPPEILVAALARWVIDLVCEREQAVPEQVALTHPTGWGPYRVDLLGHALQEMGLAAAALVTRARAVATSHEAAGDLATDADVLAVYRMGGTSVETSVLARTGPGMFELLAAAELDDVGGGDLDDAAPADVKAVLQSTVDLLVQTVHSCFAAPADLSAVLVAGGVGGRPAVVELLSATLRVPIVRAKTPQLTAAFGAALTARSLASDGRQSTTELHLPALMADGPPPLPIPASGPWPVRVPGRPTTAAERPPRPPVRVPPLEVGRR
jgi:molecular chaperone DnaK (HSP70)